LLVRRAGAHAHSRRGFTLVELLAVVALIGILAALAVVGYRRYLNASKIGEAKEIIGQIHVAQASYKSQTQGYLNCSASITDWYPAAPNGKKRAWVNAAHASASCWKLLNVAQDAPTYYGFAVVAGVAGETAPQASTVQKPNWPATTIEPWYVVQAAGDNDANGKYSYFVSSSFSPNDIYVENESE